MAKTTIQLSIEIDSDKWNEEYGTDYSHKQVVEYARRDVLEAIHSLVSLISSKAITIY